MRGLQHCLKFENRGILLCRSVSNTITPFGGPGFLVQLLYGVSQTALKLILAIIQDNPDTRLIFSHLPFHVPCSLPLGSPVLWYMISLTTPHGIPTRNPRPQNPNPPTLNPKSFNPKSRSPNTYIIPNYPYSGYNLDSTPFMHVFGTNTMYSYGLGFKRSKVLGLKHLRVQGFRVSGLVQHV